MLARGHFHEEELWYHILIPISESSKQILHPNGNFDWENSCFGGRDRACVCVSVCMWEREIERERVCVRERERVCVCEKECVCERERECVCMRVCVRVCQRECVCVCVSERGRENACECVYVCYCVSDWEWEREGQREGQREGEREGEREREFVCACVRDSGAKREREIGDKKLDEKKIGNREKECFLWKTKPNTMWEKQYLEGKMQVKW